jgi:murein DD-endopeptidase MepM/ murein hydrolase activator NlpD
MVFEEPPIQDDDTRPTMTVPVVESRWRSLLGLVSLLAAFGFTTATIFLLLNTPENETVVVQPTQEQQAESPAPSTNTPAPTVVQATAPPALNAGGEAILQFPTLNPELEAELLNAPLEPAEYLDVALIDRDRLDPFTIIPVRPREDMEQYTVVQGDTIDGIANRFGLESESIAWSNPRSKIQVIRPGDVLTIPPEDGVYENAQGQRSTLADYAEQYEVDVQTVLNHPVNRTIASLNPNAVPPSGTNIFFPGGEAEVIVWRAAIEVSGGDGGSSGTNSGDSGGVPTVEFERGQPGSCGPIPIGGGTGWTNPIPSGGYTITQGYSSFHPGIDLADSPGTPVVAANGGPVIFAGWNNFGYGYMVAIVHGPTMTVYGHLQEGSIAVGCGQIVGAGQVVGAVGSSGQSSGPHLHFEIRSGVGYSHTNPSATMGF